MSIKVVAMEVDNKQHTAEPELLSPSGAAKDAAKPPTHSIVVRKTPGEKFYDVLQFTIGNPVILVSTAALAYVARYGKDSYKGVPNVLKQFQQKLEHFMLHNKTFPMQEKGEFARRFAGAFTNTMVLFHGGNLFAPVMKWMENHKEGIVTYANKRWGTAEDVESAQTRLKDAPKQGWGDVVKGRLVAWGLVFGSFLAADTVIGKNKSGQYRFDQYEEKFGKLVAGLTKKGKLIEKLPVGKDAAYAANNTYRFGKILALDLYATSAGIAIWNFVSRRSAHKRHEEHKPLLQDLDVGPIIAFDSGEPPHLHEHSAAALKARQGDAKTPSYAQRVGEPQKDFRERAEMKPGELSTSRL